MKLTFAILFFLFLSAHSFSQSGLLILKKNHKNIKTWSTGSVFRFVDVYHHAVEGVLHKTTADSFWLRPFQLQQFRNHLGFVFIDTIWNGMAAFSKDDILSINIPKRNFAYDRSEGTAYAAGVFFSVLELTGKGGNASIVKMASFLGGGFLLGRIFRWLGKEDYVVKGKIRVELISL